MNTSLLHYIRSRGFPGDCLGYLLPKMIEHYKGDFRIFADCGGGIGHTSLMYEKMLETGLSPDDFLHAAVVVYEPLPENILELKKRTEAKPAICVREYAVSDFQGKAAFTVPRRMTGSSASWGAGTSAVGYLGANSTTETVEVDVTRLEDEPTPQFDFIKLDLQGGERKALIGLGAKLHKAKLIYAEHQLLANPAGQPLDFLTESGYICYFDRLQFGFKPAVEEIPISLLKEGGITIERFRGPDARGMSSSGIFWGTLDVLATRHLGADGKFSAEYADRLRAAGALYIQTDVVAIHRDVYSNVLGII